MKFRFKIIQVFILIFILGAFCVPCSKKSMGEPVLRQDCQVEDVLPLINDTVARGTQFADPRANYNDDIRNGLANKICEDLDGLNKAWEGNNMGEIAKVLRRWRKPGETNHRPPGEIIRYLAQLKKEKVENFQFKFVGAVVVPVKIELNPFPDLETNFFSLNTYIFTFERSSVSGSTDPAGSGDGDSEHRKICTWN